MPKVRWEVLLLMAVLAGAVGSATGAMLMLVSVPNGWAAVIGILTGVLPVVYWRHKRFGLKRVSIVWRRREDHF